MILLGGLLWGLMGTPVHAQQLLLNRSCESVTDTESKDPSNWTEVDEDWGCDDVAAASPQDGSKYFVYQNAGIIGKRVLRQDVSAEEGTTVSFSGQIITTDSNNEEGKILIEYLDGGGTVLDSFSTGSDSNGGFITTGGTWETKQMLREAPEGTQTLRVELQVRPTGTFANGDVNVYFDDLRLNGKIQVTEVMQNPSDVGDSDGEYIELYNSTASNVSLDGWTLNGHSIGNVTAPARGSAVLCSNDNADQNGGVETCDDELSSLSLGDDTDTITLKDGNGITIDEISYTAGSSGWPDPSGASMVFTAVTGTNTGGNWSTAPRRERGFRLDEGGDLGSPGRNGTKQSVQPTANVASKSAGWQMLSAPVAGVNAYTLAQANLVQGLSGHFPNDDVNLYQWPGGTESNNDWTKPSSPTADLTSKGTGYIWYVFGSTGTSKTDTPPFTVSVPGVVRTTDVTTNDLSGTSSGSAFHLLGNPYGQSFDLSGLNLSAQGFQTTVQVWDPSEGSYDSISQAGDNSDLVSAYQGFFVERATSGKATLTFSASGRTSSSASLKSNGEGPGHIAFRLTGQNAEGDTLTRDLALTLQVRSDASVGWDVHDASKLVPLSGPPYATAAFRGSRDGESVLQAVTSVPTTLPEDSIGVPIALNMSGAGDVEDFTLAWPEWSQIPGDWRLTLHDAVADTTVNLRTQSSYTFAVPDDKRSRGSNARDKAGRIPVPRPPSPREAKAAVGTPRFTLSLQSGTIPVELTRLEVAQAENRAVLTWRTATETDNAGFRIEHRRPRAKGFQPLGFVKGAGTTDRPQHYRYRTGALSAGTHAFRLRQIDTDGSEHLSRTVTLEVALSTSHRATIAPHPIRKQGHLRLTVATEQRVQVAVYDLLGRRLGTIYDERLSANEPTWIQLPPNRMQLASGAYFVEILGKTFRETKRFVIVP